MNNEQGVDDDKQVVRVPEGVEACYFLQWSRELELISSEPWCSQCEGYGH